MNNFKRINLKEYNLFTLLFAIGFLSLLNSCGTDQNTKEDNTSIENKETLESSSIEDTIQIQAVNPDQYGIIENMNFAKEGQNLVSPKTQVIGISINNKSKAYPIYMISYHHQIKDKIDDQPIWVTYCFKCRTSRIYDPIVDGEELDFKLYGLYNDNSVFRDTKTNSTWLQETGKGIYGPYTNTELKEFFSEQTSLKNWLLKYPDSEILQYDPKYIQWYQASEKAYRLPTDISQQAREERSIIIGVDFDGYAKGYDWEILKQEKIILDQLGNTAILLLNSPDGTSFYAYNRMLDGKELLFRKDGDMFVDIQTNSKWNFLGQCIAGDLKDTQLEPIQAYQQIWQYWKYFHPNSTRY